MAMKQPVVTTEQNITNETYTVRKDFWTTYSRPIIYIGSAIILAIAAFFAYRKFIKEPKELKAREAVFPAEGLFDKMASTGFNKDSVNIVLNGGMLDGTNIKGLLRIMKDHKGTDAANRAAYMTGASYLHVGDFDKAIKYLKEFDANGAYQTEIRADEMLGHAYAEKKNVDEALSWYKKAASVNDKDEAYTAEALVIAAGYAEKNGKTKDAIELYSKARDEYQNFPAVQNGDLEKHLAKLGVLK